MLLTSDLKDILASYGIELPGELRDYPETFDSFNDLSMYLKHLGRAEMASMVLEYLPLLDEALKQFLVRERTKLPELPTASIALGEAFDKQTFLRLFTCPTVLAENPEKELSLDDLFVEPVTTKEGDTYEKEQFIKAWKSVNKDMPLPDDLFVPNRIIKGIIKELKAGAEAEEALLDNVELLSEAIDFKEMFEDPIDFMQLKRPILLDRNGNSFNQQTIEEWLEKTPKCPFNSEQPCSVSQLRENKLLQQVYDYYEKHIEVKQTPKQALRSVFEHEKKEALKQELTHFFDRLDSLDAPIDDVSFLKDLRHIMGALPLVFYYFTDPLYQSDIFSAELDKNQVLVYLLEIHELLSRVVDVNKALLKYHGPDNQTYCLSKLHDFKNRINLQQKCLDPEDNTILAKYKFQSKVNVDLMFIVRNDVRDARDEFVLVFKSLKAHASPAQMIAKSIASSVHSRVHTVSDAKYSQYQITTKNLGIFLLALEHLNLITGSEVYELREQLPDVLGNYDELSRHPQINSLYKKLDSDIKSLDSPGFWSQVHSFFKSPEPSSAAPKGTEFVIRNSF